MKKRSKADYGLTVLSVNIKTETLKRFREKIAKEALRNGWPEPAASPFVVALIERYIRGKS